MHESPVQIARSLRALRNAHRQGLLHGVSITAGSGACDAARSQQGALYAGDEVPRLPLAKCTVSPCACKYSPIGSDQLRNSMLAASQRAEIPERS
jgi:hypothetical protein